MGVQTKDNDLFGNFRIDFQTQPTSVDAFFNDVPPIPVEKGEADIELDEWEIDVFPNPFNSKIRIHVRGQRTEDRGQTAEIQILNVSGKIVCQLTSDLCHLTSGISWNASHHPSGIYIAEIRAGNRRFNKTLTLLQ
jgi:hypothetical protein